MENLTNIILDLVNRNPKHFANTSEYKQLRNNLLPYKWASTPEEAVYILLHNLTIKPHCNHCNKDVKFMRVSYGYQKYCSCSCRAKANESYKNGLTDKAMAAKKLTLANRTDEQQKLINEKVRKTSIQNNTNTGAKASFSAKVKYSNTVGVDLDKYCSLFDLPTAYMLLDKYGTPTGIANSYLGNIETTKKVKSILTRIGCKWNNKLSRGSSSQEESLQAFILELLPNTEVLFNKKGLLLDSKLELDIYIPSMKLAIEYCGHYWHNYDYQGNTKHLRKLTMCNELGIRLITIFEGEWQLKKAIVKSRISHAVGSNNTLFARKCSVDFLDKKVSDEFTEAYHLQGKCGAVSDSVDIGLYNEGKLVACATLAKPRYSNKYAWELIRYTTNYSIVGGLSKILSLFRKNYIGSIVSYCDLRWGTGGVYSSAGFTLSHVSNPNYYYFLTSKPLTLYSRTKFMKHKIIQNYGGDPSLTEYENMKKLGYRKIYDCGNQVWELLDE